MKVLYIILIILIPSIAFTQQVQPTTQKWSEKKLVYKISTKQAQQYLLMDSIPINDFENAIVYKELMVKNDSADYLPIGNYVLVSANLEVMSFELLNRSDLNIAPVNFDRHFNFDIVNAQGFSVKNAIIFLNGKDQKQKENKKIYTVKGKRLEEKLITVFTETDTLFSTIDITDDYPSIGTQRWKTFKNTRLIKYFTFLPNHLKDLIEGKKHNPKRKKYSGGGFIAFNQPKYKPLDSVFFKTYLLSKRKKQYTKKVLVRFSYHELGKYKEVKLPDLSATTAGAYLGKFLLGDSIPIDFDGTITFYNKQHKKLISASLKGEDYLLSTISTYKITSSAEEYVQGDSIIIYASAKDANNLNLLDGRTELYITTTSISLIGDSIITVNDTLFTQKQPLRSEGDTKFSFSTDSLPKASLSLKAEVRFLNSNNEIKTKEKAIIYNWQKRKIDFEEKADSLTINYLVNGKSTIADAYMETDDNAEELIKLPLTIKINPSIKNYFVSLADEKISANHDIEEYKIRPAIGSSQDTLLVQFINPKKVKLNYRINFGNELITEGWSSDELTMIRKKISKEKRAYRLSWSYYWAGEEERGTESVGIFYKTLNLEVDAKNKVAPGEIDSVKIKVTDFKGNSVSRVNLTGISYNNQFGEQKIPRLPYTSNYKGKRYLQRERYEYPETAYAKQQYFFHKNEAWLKKLSIDTLKYYKMLLPEKELLIRTFQNAFLPTITINVVEKGRALEMYLIHINNQFVYTNLAKEKTALVFENYPGYTKFAIRLLDKTIIIDSIYLQSNYKHDLIFDIDNLPKNSSVRPEEKYWTKGEKALLESSLMQLEDNSVHNNAYLWQGNNVIRLGNQKHLAGPFSSNKIGFYQPGKFDMEFQFEPGYEYRLSKNITRLEKKNIFSTDVEKNYLGNGKYGKLNFEDTLVILPAITYELPQARNYLSRHREAYKYMNSTIEQGKARLQILRTTTDSTIKYVVLKNIDSTNDVLILSGDQFAHLTPGNYEILLLTSNFKIYRYKMVSLNANATTVLKMPQKHYFHNQALIDSLGAYYDKPKIENAQPEKAATKPMFYDPYNPNTKGGLNIAGTIIDAVSKNPIAGASINISNTNVGTSASATGNYEFYNLKAGKHILQFNAVGYSSKQIEILIRPGQINTTNVELSFSAQMLYDVVVTGYLNQRKAMMTGAAVSVQADNLLSGKVAGLNVQGYQGPNLNITIRGASSYNSQNEPLYVVNGIVLTTAQFKALDPNSIKAIEILNDASATAIYGAKAINGVILITTETKTERKTFRDFAYWNPNFFTDKNGEAIMLASYPDNVTGWHSYILGIDKKNRTGKAEFITQSYKPMLVELSVPQFLIQGDVSNMIGKSLNYTEDDYKTTSYFTINGTEQEGKAFTLAKKSSSISSQNVTTTSLDTLKLNYRLSTTTGYKDGEERRIPVLRRGIEEFKGQFYILKSDTSFSITASENASKLYLYAQNNTMDLLLEEIEHIKDYSYYCMEQTASKLTGYYLQKKIFIKTGKTFTGEKDMTKLLSKLQAGQLYSGAWSWWGNGQPNFVMTNYITNALLPLRDQPLVEQNIRNACLYLQNNLKNYDRRDLLSALVTLNKANNYMEFGQWLDKIKFDSLSTFEQWNFIAIKQAQKLDFNSELDKLLKKQIPGMLGSVHWGEERNNWSNNNVASTLLALDVLKKTNYSSTYSDKILQYFLELRNRGYWRNTVESARITDAIFDLYAAKDFNQNEKATLSINGDTSVIITKFPYQLKTNAKNISLQKFGNGIMYLTAYEKIFNTNPVAVTDNFVVTTSFTKNNLTEVTLKAGEQYNLLVVVDAKTDADFVQIDIPIPAACNYANKTTLSQYFPQYAKDKLILFTEKLSKGVHQFIIPLEARYTGTYNLNPAKVELMYFPTFFGREGMKTIVVE